jgi:peptide/nickel transport system permease protein
MFEKIDSSLIKRLKKDKVTLVGIFVLIFLYTAILFAPFVAPYSQTHSSRDLSYTPPCKIFTVTSDYKLSKPYTYNYVREFNPETYSVEYKMDRSKKYYINFLQKGESYKLFGFIPSNIHLFGVDKGGEIFLLGTDINGRDNFSRLLFGGQISLTIGFLALFISFPIGMLYGGISGYFGGVTDMLMMRVAEAIMSIPSFYLLIILAAVLPSGMSSVQRFTMITAILAFIGWAGFARVIRGMVLSIKEQEFIEASKSIGAGSFRIITKHILPQTISYVVVAITLSVPGYILAESGLSFLGLGIQQPDASWGNMLKEAQEYVNILSRPWLLTPGFLIFIAVLSFNLVGDTIRDILDPKSKARR